MKTNAMTQIVLLICTCFFSILATANPPTEVVPISGTYTIGVSGNYTTVSAAIAAITTNGIDGPVIFNILNGSYNEQVEIGEITGASATNTITIQSQSGNANDVIISFSSINYNPNYVFKLADTGHLFLVICPLRRLGLVIL